MEIYDGEEKISFDAVAVFFGEGETKRIFDYLCSIDSVGYRCTIDREAALKWLHQKDMDSL